MNVSGGQFYVFLACLSIGGIFGVFYTIFGLVKLFIKNNIFLILFDVFIFVVLSIFYIIASYLFGFPSFRFYMPIAVLIGFILYLESFYLILAKLLKKLYNKIEGKIRIFINRRKERVDRKLNSKDKLVDGRF